MVAPVLFTKDVFVQQYRRLFTRRIVWFVTLVAMLGLFSWIFMDAFALFSQELTIMEWVRQLSSRVGALLLVFAFAIYRIRAYPWQPNRAFTPVSEDPMAMLRQSGWLALEQARELADTLHRPLGLGHVLLGCFVTHEGASVLARLGMTFDAIQTPFIELVREGGAVNTSETAPVIESLLKNAHDLATSEGTQQGIGAIELIRAALSLDTRLADALERAGADRKHVEGIGRWLAVQAALKADHDRFIKLSSAKPSSDLNRTMTARFTVLLNQISEDLTRSAKNGFIPPMVERADAWTSCVRAWEGGQRAIVLVGPEGVGKTAFIEDLARRMVIEDVPPMLFDKRLVSVHVAELVTGADPGVISDRLLQLASEVAQSTNIVLVLEGVEALAGAGYGGTRDLFEILSAEIERLGLFVIATTTPEGWHTHLENRVFGKRSTKITINPPEKETLEAILITHAGGLEYKHGVFFTYAGLEVALEAADQVSTGLVAPGNALEWIREAAALTRRNQGERALVGRTEVAQVVEEKTGIPARIVQDDEAARLLRLEDGLKTRVIGQTEAVVAVAQAMRRARADVRSGHRPLATFLFLGPTGVGKTELAKALAQEYFGGEERMVRVDCSEYQALSSVSRLIGEPQDQKGGLLTEAIRQKPYTLLLLDELEKAHPDILTLFLQVFDDGRLTDGVGRTIDFSHTIIIATSNASASFVQERVAAGVSGEQLRRELLDRELKKTFRPEFLNRFDGIHVFQPLTLDDVTRIAWLMLHTLEKHLEEKGLKFHAEDAAVERLAHDGYDREFGARPLRRLIQDRVETAIADLLLKKEAKRGDTIVLREDGQIGVETK
ncbi:ATP-dependent Clp protease ATP-binding subunit [Patescibacteria group bacterium]|nr:ATP-dependent Clp protease ATP-binding subunit [Patescibacteria group bacterium]